MSRANDSAQGREGYQGGVLEQRWLEITLLCQPLSRKPNIYLNQHLHQATHVLVRFFLFFGAIMRHVLLDDAPTAALCGFCVHRELDYAPASCMRSHTLH